MNKNKLYGIFGMTDILEKQDLTEEARNCSRATSPVW
jgi:hypothetical protein